MIGASIRAFATGLILCASACSTRTVSHIKSLTISTENAELLDKLASYPDLEVLQIRCLEDLRAFPDSIGKLTKLKELIKDNGNECSMNPVLPESLGNLNSLEKLVLFGAQDPRDHDESGGLRMKERHKFPASMSRLQRLVYLDLGRNVLEEIPPFVGDWPHLKVLGFAWNMKFKTVPAFLTRLQELTTLQLEANDLIDLPSFLNNLPKLRVITLGYNCKITQSQARMADLKRRFPEVKFDFTDECDCPDTSAK